MVSFDMYRKVPADLLEGTRRGSVFSIFAIIVMATLFMLETMEFLRTTMVTEMLIDGDDSPKVRVNFNITMLDLRCEYAVVDVVSVLGTEQNVTQHVNKWNLDQEGVRKRYHGRNKNQKDILYFDESVTSTIEELHEDGEDAEMLDPDQLAKAMKENQFVFVDFFAGWCSHCQVLAPTWETLAEVMHEVATESLEEKLADKYPSGDHGYSEEEYHAAVKVLLPVKIAKVDCVAHEDFCLRQQQVLGYPTLRLFHNGEKYGDYNADRTIVHFTNYLARVEEDVKPDVFKLDHADTRVKESFESQSGLPRKAIPQWKDEEHPGCQISGFLMVDRVPGNFHIKARSNKKNLIPSMTNVSHEIHHLSFGDPSMSRIIERGRAYVPDDLNGKLSPMDGFVYVTSGYHQAHHHHLKIVTTEFNYSPGTKRGKTYQLLGQSQLAGYEPDVVPEARFIYDLSPVSMLFKQKGRKWYDYLTSVMAIIGGTFTVVGMVESSIHSVASKKRR